MEIHSFSRIVDLNNYCSDSDWAKVRRDVEFDSHFQTDDCIQQEILYCFPIVFMYSRYIYTVNKYIFWVFTV